MAFRSVGFSPRRNGAALIERLEERMIALEPHPAGTILPVRAHAGARRSEIHGTQDGQLKVSVTQVPEKGKANKAIIALLSRGLSLKKSRFELLAGETTTQKRFLVRGVGHDELAAKVTAALG